MSWSVRIKKLDSNGCSREWFWVADLLAAQRGQVGEWSLMRSRAYPFDKEEDAVACALILDARAVKDRVHED